MKYSNKVCWHFICKCYGQNMSEQIHVLVCTFFYVNFSVLVPLFSHHSPLFTHTLTHTCTPPPHTYTCVRVHIRSVFLSLSLPLFCFFFQEL